MNFKNAFFLTTLAAIIWGATAPIMKLTLAQVPVFSLAFLRMGVAALILGLLISKKLKIRKADLATFFWAAIFGVSLNLAFFFIGLKLTQAILAAFLIAAVPIGTLIAAHIYLREKFTFRLIFASIVAFLGVALIVGRLEGPQDFKQILGNFLLLLSSASWIVYELINKKLLKVYDASVVAFYSMGIGAVTFFPLFLAELVQNPGWIGHVNLAGFLGILYGIFFSSLVAYLAWQKGLSQLPAGQAAFFFYLDPVSGAIVAMILLGEKLTPTLVVGGFLIILGVLMAEQRRREHPAHRRLLGQSQT